MLPVSREWPNVILFQLALGTAVHTAVAKRGADEAPCGRSYRGGTRRTLPGFVVFLVGSHPLAILGVPVSHVFAATVPVVARPLFGIRQMRLTILAVLALTPFAEALLNVRLAAVLTHFLANPFPIRLVILLQVSILTGTTVAVEPVLATLRRAEFRGDLFRPTSSASLQHALTSASDCCCTGFNATRSIPCATSSSTTGG